MTDAASSAAVRATPPHHFDRWGLWRGSTWALHEFRRHHTEINRLYWTHAILTSFTGRATARADRRTPAEELGSKAGSGDITRGWAEWTRATKDALNWVRLVATLSLASYLELYVKRVSLAALESDPGVLVGSVDHIDGYRVRGGLPQTTRASIEFYVERLCNGPWDVRVDTYRKVFGHVPDALRKATGELQRLQTLRNSVGHRFGRGQAPVLDYVESANTPMVRVSEGRFLGWLSLVYNVAVDVDDHLGPKHIGEFETLRFFDAWMRTPKNRQQLIAHGARPFRGALKRHLGVNGPGQVFTKELAAYVAER